MTPKGHAIPSKTQLLSYGTPAFARGLLFWSIAECQRIRRYLFLHQGFAVGDIEQDSVKIQHSPLIE